MAGGRNIIKILFILLRAQSAKLGVANSGHCDYSIERLELWLATYSSAVVCIERSSEQSKKDNINSKKAEKTEKVSSNSYLAKDKLP